MQKSSKLKVKIPAWANNETPVMLSGKVHWRQCGPAGNLHAVLQVKPHEHFERRGDDIYISMNINVAQPLWVRLRFLW